MISDPNRYVLDSGWFYDSNFHLNSAGAVLRTCRLAEDLLAQLGCGSKLQYTLPEMPASAVSLADAPAGGDHFTFEALGSGLLVSGLTEDGLAQTVLTVPASHDGKPVVGFTSDALSRAELLQELTLPESIETLPDRLFEGCTALERLILLHRQKLCSISENTFAGAESLRILVPEEAYPLLPGRRWLRGNPLARAPGYDFFHWLTAYQQQDRIIPNVPKAAAPR